MNNGENQKKNVPKTLIICAIIFVIVFAIANITDVVDVVSSVFSVLSPIIIGFALAYILNPILKFYEFLVFKKLKKKNLIRALSLIATLLTAVAIIVSFLWLLVPSVVTSVKDIVSNYDEYVDSSVDFINSIINKIYSNEHFTEYVSAETITDWVISFFASSGELMQNIINYISEFGLGLFVGVKNTVIGIFIAIYVLITKEKIQAIVRKFATAFISPRKLAIIGKYVSLTHKTFSGYLVGTVTDAIIVMFLTLILLLIFGIHYPLLIAVIVGATNIIPIFGPFIGSIPSFFILFLVDPQEAFIFLALIILIQQFDGNVIAPKILGESTGISSLAVIVAIIIMGEYFGIVGMIIGVPIFAVCGAILTELADTRLSKRGKSANVDDYYRKEDMIDPTRKRKPIIAKLFDGIVAVLIKLVRSLIRKNRKKSPKNNADASDESAE